MTQAIEVRDLSLCSFCPRPMRYVFFFRADIGHFQRGHEPRMCADCAHAYEAQPDAVQIEKLRPFPVDAEPTRDPITEAEVRSNELRSETKA